LYRLPDVEEALSMIGKNLGNFEISTLLGRGGMGEVYQAKDLKLGRDVAIKVLPEEFAKDADRVARFQREAKLLASLNHPNIAAIYGLEESEGSNFLVLELVEGNTLADQIKRGPIPVEESLKLALQIAEALEAAHEKGVIHRDLKPANIKVTPDGKVKVLDFGLAKAFAGDQEVNLSNSPTLSDAATQQGVILGTAAYMSPEQAKGKTVDKRADIWAFGVVLFEMLTGRQVFTGETVSDTLASVLAREPKWQSLPSNLHPRIRLLLERCLKKEPKDRYGVINDARVDIQEVLADPGGVFAQAPTAEAPAGLRRMLPWIAAALVLGAIIAGLAVWKLKPTEPRRVMRFEYDLPEGQQFADPSWPDLAVSPDGSQFVYATTKGLYLRSVDSLDSRHISGTDKDSAEPFFSPDGQWIGYFSYSDLKLKKVAISGGAPVALCDISGFSYGASWDSADTILYTDESIGIMRISANGGTAEPLVKANLTDLEKEGFPTFPQMLPDGKNLLFTGQLPGDEANYQIVVQSLKSGDRRVLAKGSAWNYLPTGHIVYSLLNNNVENLFALPFDLDRLEVTGSSVSILEGIRTIAFSDSGTLIYVPQPAITAGVTGAASSGRTLVLVDGQGKEAPLGAEPQNYIYMPRISPDGTRVALTILTGGNYDIWIWEMARKTMTRLTFNEGTDIWPVWTRDGKQIIYSSGKGILSDSVCRKAADGTGEVEQLVSVAGMGLLPTSMSKDAKTLILWEITPAPLTYDIGMMSMEGEHTKKPLLQKKYNESHGRVSPDGRWMAYQSNESGKYEIYVRQFPDVERGGRWQVSTNGGSGPLWSPDGRELFYRSGDVTMSVDVETNPVFKPGHPKILFRGNYLSDNHSAGGAAYWDIHPDGKRFLMIKPPGAAPSAEGSPQKINIVVNWFEELKQSVPVK
jgi:eukaryotic-like serine/threonine-protein kinase